MNQIKVFKHPILNKLSRTNPLVAISIYCLISLGMVIYGFAVSTPLLTHSVALFVAGLLLFSLVEYATHRFMYHSGENYQDEKNWQYKVHGVHHAVPNEKDLLALPIPLALLVSGLLFMLFYLPMGQHALFFFPGFLSGYAAYLFVHYKVHTSKPPKNAFSYLWKHHLIHHYSDDERAYGVSSPLWDIVFGTMPKKTSTKKKHH
jgi:sterol desaturase/sphingolipid hydroxylase (fatty acid hydroxylase superfamily)